MTKPRQKFTLFSLVAHPLAALNTVLTALHLRRASRWEPPTLLDSWLASPLQWLASLLYRRVLLPLRGKPFHPPRNRRRIRVVCLSDTHSRTTPPPPTSSSLAGGGGGGGGGIGKAAVLEVPEGDLLIHCGDLTEGGTREEIQRQVDWLRGLPHRWKVVVGGNHDNFLDPAWRKGEKDGAERKEAEVDWTGVEYLCDRAIELEFEGGRRLNVYGWGAVPWCGEESAFQYRRETHPWKGRIPDETDVLVTHTPPRHHLDLGLGCGGLLDEVWRVKPKLHVFGHVHWGHGKEAVYYDEPQRAYESLMSRPARGLFHDLIPGPHWTDAFNMLFSGVSNILWKWIMLGPGTNNGALMANASVMYGNTGRLRNPVTVVDL